MSNIYFIRHWKTDNNLGWFLNWWEEDQELSVEWLNDFENINFQKQILGMNLYKIYFSPLRRTTQTALKIKEIIEKFWKSVLIEKSEGLKEQLYWEFTWKTFEELLQLYPNISFDKISYIYRIENTKWESWSDFSERVYKDFLKIKNDNIWKNILLVAHGGTYRALLYKIFWYSVDDSMQRSNWLKNLEIKEIIW